MPRLPFTDRTVLKAQTAYFLVTGLWPFIHYRSFEWVSGPKRDDWLVKTVSALILAVAAGLLAGLRRPEASRETRTLALASAAALGGASAWYTLTGRVRPTYLGDAAVEAALIVALRAAPHERSR